MAGASKFGGTENGPDCSKCGGTVAVLFKTRNGTSLQHMLLTGGLPRLPVRGIAVVGLTLVLII